LNTRNILRRRKKVLDEGYNCVMCHNNGEETATHLFFSYPAATSR
jgi:transcription elongation factor Elf1